MTVKAPRSRAARAMQAFYGLNGLFFMGSSCNVNLGHADPTWLCVSGAIVFAPFAYWAVRWIATGRDIFS